MADRKIPMSIDPSKMLDLSNYLYGFAAFLTLLATFGVIYYGRVVSKVKDDQVKQYQKDADERIAASNKSAAEANAVAVSAQARIKELDRQIAEANSAAKVADSDAAKANLELQRIKTPRRLTPKQQKELLAKLKSQPGHPFVAYVFGDQESGDLINVIAPIMQEAGWSLLPSDSVVNSGKAGITTLSGVHVRVPAGKKESLEPAATFLAQALRDVGIICNTEIFPDSTFTTAEIHLMVGKKP